MGRSRGLATGIVAGFGVLGPIGKFGLSLLSLASRGLLIEPRILIIIIATFLVVSGKTPLLWLSLPLLLLLLILLLSGDQVIALIVDLPIPDILLVGDGTADQSSGHRHELVPLHDDDTLLLLILLDGHLPHPHHRSLRQFLLLAALGALEDAALGLAEAVTDLAPA